MNNNLKWHSDNIYGPRGTHQIANISSDLFL